MRRCSPKPDGRITLLKMDWPDGETWLEAEVAAEYLRPLSLVSIYRLADEGLLMSFYPKPRRRLFSLSSIRRFQKAREADDEFWQKNLEAPGRIGNIK